MSDIVKALRVRAQRETSTGITEPQEHIDWIAADEITRLREEIGRLTMALAEAETRAERDYLRFVDADREEIKRLLEEAVVWEHDNGVMWRLLTLVTAEKDNLRERIRLLTEDMPAGDARRQLAEQHAEIERLKRMSG